MTFNFRVIHRHLLEDSNAKESRTYVVVWTFRPKRFLGVTNDCGNNFFLMSAMRFGVQPASYNLISWKQNVLQSRSLFRKIPQWKLLSSFVCLENIPCSYDHREKPCLSNEWRGTRKSFALIKSTGAHQRRKNNKLKARRVRKQC